MNNKIISVIAIIIMLIIISLSGCGAGHVSVGVGVYAPGAWGPYGGGYYPPVGIGVGYPIY
ncbi:MAG: hypothetical protein ACHQLA_01185 [Ignavibacteriales bacterium]